MAVNNATHDIVSPLPPMDSASARATALRVGVPCGTSAHLLCHLWRNAYLPAGLPVELRPMEPGGLVDAYLAGARRVALSADIAAMLRQAGEGSINLVIDARLPGLPEMKLQLHGMAGRNPGGEIHGLREAMQDMSEILEVQEALT